MVGDASGKYAAGRDVGRVGSDDIELHITERCKEIADANIGTRFVEMIPADIFQNCCLVCRVNLAEVHVRVRQPRERCAADSA